MSKSGDTGTGKVVKMSEMSKTREELHLIVSVITSDVRISEELILETELKYGATFWSYLLELPFGALIILC